MIEAMSSGNIGAPAASIENRPPAGRDPGEAAAGALGFFFFRGLGILRPDRNWVGMSVTSCFGLIGINLVGFPDTEIRFI